MEQWDVFDENNAPIGRVTDKKTGLGPGEYRRIVELWVRGADGKYLIQRRAQTKKLYPGMWYCSVAGAVQAGETPMEAARRESAEELALALEAENGVLYDVITEDRIHFYIWLFRQEVQMERLRPEPAEVADVRRASAEEIREMCREGSFIALPYYADFFAWAEAGAAPRHR